jgi:hypothetical protein
VVRFSEVWFMWAVYRRLCSVMQGGDLHRWNRAQMLLANLRNATQNLFYRVIQGERSIILGRGVIVAVNV